MVCQQATLSGEAERPKVADAVIEALSEEGVIDSTQESQDNTYLITG
jgi:hypothetical protein